MYFSFWRRSRFHSWWFNSSCCQNVSDCNTEKCDDASNWSSWWWRAFPEWENKQVSCICLFLLLEEGRGGGTEVPWYPWMSMARWEALLCIGQSKPTVSRKLVSVLSRKQNSQSNTIIHFMWDVYSVFKFITLAIFISLAMKFASGLKDDGEDGHSSITASVLKCASHRHSWLCKDFSGYQYKWHKDLFIAQGPKLA